MYIGEGMLIGIPTAKAQIDTANEGNGVVDDDEFLVVSLDSQLSGRSGR